MLWTGDVKFMAGQCPDFLFQCRQLRVKDARQLMQSGLIHQHPVAFHFQQYRHQWQIARFIQMAQFFIRIQLWPHQVIQCDAHGCIFGGVRGCGRDIQRVKAPVGVAHFRREQ